MNVLLTGGAGGGGGDNWICCLLASATRGAAAARTSMASVRIACAMTAEDKWKLRSTNKYSNRTLLWARSLFHDAVDRTNLLLFRFFFPKLSSTKRLLFFILKARACTKQLRIAVLAQ